MPIMNMARCAEGHSGSRSGHPKATTEMREMC